VSAADSRPVVSEVSIMELVSPPEATLQDLYVGLRTAAGEGRRRVEGGGAGPRGFAQREMADRLDVPMSQVRRAIGDLQNLADQIDFGQRPGNGDEWVRRLGRAPAADLVSRLGANSAIRAQLSATQRTRHRSREPNGTPASGLQSRLHRFDSGRRLSHSAETPAYRRKRVPDVSRTR
jgi:hypothetical protein